jgi:hypothetical protein
MSIVDKYWSNTHFLSHRMQSSTTLWYSRSEGSLLVGIMLNDPTSYNIPGVLTGSKPDQVTQKPTNDPSATLREFFRKKRRKCVCFCWQSQLQPQQIAREWTENRVIGRTNHSGEDAPLGISNFHRWSEKENPRWHLMSWRVICRFLCGKNKRCDFSTTRAEIKIASGA